MSAQMLIAVIVGIGAVLAISSGGIAKAKEFFKSSDTDKKKAIEGGSQPARSEASQDQMPLTDKERKTSEQIKKISDGLEIFEKPDDLPRNDSDLSRFDTKIKKTVNAKTASDILTPQQQKGAHYLRETAIPNDIKYSTSLTGSVPTTGQQIKRTEPVVITNAKSLGGSSALQAKIVLEQQRAETLSKTLYGETANPNFVKSTKVSDPKPTSTQKLTTDESKTKKIITLEEAIAFNREVIAKKKAATK